MKKAYKRMIGSRNREKVFFMEGEDNLKLIPRLIAFGEPVFISPVSWVVFSNHFL